jgi:molecular chaperone GrpE (heat shock protein)
MNQEEEIQYWKEKYRILKLSMQTEQKTVQDNQDRMHKFKMVPIIEDLLRFISFDLSKSTTESYEQLRDSQNKMTKWKVNQELGVDYYELGE